MKQFLLVILLSFFILPYYTVNTQLESKLKVREFVSIQPDTKSPVPDSTVCEVSYDKENVYFSWVVKKQTGFSIVKKGRKDEIQDTDFLRAQITTLPGDNFCYVFYVFPDGSTVDAIRDADFNLSTEWDSHFRAENTFTDSLWNCRMIIPFKDLRYEGTPPYQWNVSFCRQYYLSNELFSAPFMSISQMGRDYFKSGYPLSINELLPIKLNIQIIPYFTPAYDIKDKETKYGKDQLGCDFSFKPRSLMNFKLSVNPDFSDVPIDRAQNNFNLKYEPFYNENRYFFIEDLDVFDIETDVFYSRNIIQPEIAAKLTDTSDDFTYGAMFCKDKNSDAQEFKNNYYMLLTDKLKWEDKDLASSAVIMKNDTFENYVFMLNPAYYFSPTASIAWDNSITLYHDSSDVKKGLDTFFTLSSRKDELSRYFKLGFYTKDFIAKMGRIYDPSIAYGEVNYSFSKYGYKEWEDFEFTWWLEPTLTTKTFALYKVNTGIYLKLDPKGSFYSDFNLSYTLLKENDKVHRLPQARNYISSSLKEQNLYLSMMYSFGQEYNYDLMKTAIFAYIEPSIDFKPLQYLNFYGSVLLYQYPYLSNTDNQIVDDFFHIINIEVKNYLTQDISVSSGLRYSQYFTGNYGYYSNVQYEVNQDVSIYGGVSKGAGSIEHRWVTDYNTIFMKFRAVLNI